jgi:hypothetical protein
MRNVSIHESTLEKILASVYDSYEDGELSDDEYSAIMSTLSRGIPQSVSCPGITFHRNPGHVCEVTS